MGLIILGCLLIPEVKKRPFSFFMSTSFLWIFLAALGTTAYTLLDSWALDILNRSHSFSKGYAAIFYMTCQTLVIIINLIIYTLFNRSERVQLSETVRVNKKAALYAGLFLTLAYLLVLRAMVTAGLVITALN